MNNVLPLIITVKYNYSICLRKFYIRVCLRTVRLALCVISQANRLHVWDVREWYQSLHLPQGENVGEHITQGVRQITGAILLAQKLV